MAGLYLFYSSASLLPWNGSRFNPSVEDFWYGLVALLFRFHVRTDRGDDMECTRAMIETLRDY